MEHGSWHKFCESTTIHGVYDIRESIQSQKPGRSCFWITVFFICILATGWQFCNNLILYFDFDVSTSISYQTKSELVFPAITICNENIYRKSVAANSELILFMSGFNGKVNELNRTINEVSVRDCNENQFEYCTFYHYHTLSLLYIYFRTTKHVSIVTNLTYKT